ncbi:MAG TPA: AraC family transcriptional regulator [Ramlibacter sp.]|nr:AraC family transcriptional regulator [Ramlibacter sp.]
MAGKAQTIRSATLQGFPAVAAELGLNAAQMMRRAGLPARCLDDLSTQVSVDGVRKLLELTAEASGVDDVGLRLARNRRLSNLGPVALALRQEPTGLQALETLCRYFHIVNVALLIKIEQVNDLIYIREELMLAHAAPARQALEMSVGMMFQTLREVLGAQWRARMVCFTHRPPSDMRAHRALFGAQVEFNAAFNGIICNLRDLKQELPRTDPDMARYARDYLERAIGPVRHTNVEVVRQLVSVLMPSGRCTVDQVAQHLEVDRRTVHRWLEAEEETFSSILRQVRREFVQRRLAESDSPIAEVGKFLGFSSSSAFAHWFRTEFDSTAAAWRRAQGPARRAAKTS